jgi:hypothetical protein
MTLSTRTGLGSQTPHLSIAFPLVLGFGKPFLAPDRIRTCGLKLRKSLGDL